MSIGRTDQPACVGKDPELFYSDYPSAVKRAKAICATCPVREACLKQGMDEEFGVWGGLSPEDRAGLRRHRDTVKAQEASAQSRAEAAQERLEEARRLYANGLSRREIAERLGITYKALCNYYKLEGAA